MNNKKGRVARIPAIATKPSRGLTCNHGFNTGSQVKAA